MRCLSPYQPKTPPINCHCAVFCWLLLVAISPVHRAAEPDRFDVALHVSQQEVEIAEPLEVTLRAAAPLGWQILPPVTPTDWQGLRVIGSTETTEQTNDQMVWTRHVTVEGYEAGRKTISPLEVTFAPPRLPSPSGRAAGGEGGRQNALNREAKAPKLEPRKMKSAAAEIYVRSALGLFESGTELRSIYDPVAVPWSWRQWTMAAGGSVLIVGCGWLVVRWVNRFHDDDGSLSRRGLLGELARLKEAWLRGRESDRETVVAASEIARRWLRWRQKAGTIHRTTDDWAALVRHWNVATIAPIMDVLGLADRVKFAQVEPTLDEVRESLERVRQVMQVERVVPLPLPSPPEAGREGNKVRAALPLPGTGEEGSRARDAWN